MKTQQLPQDYAIVLQQISDDGSEDFGDLADTLHYDRSRLLHIVQSLYHKGLITMGNDSWLQISLSHKGQRLLAYLWPESTKQFSY